MFDYAMRKKYITANPLSDMKITVRYRQVVKKSGNTQTYNTDELEALNNYLRFDVSGNKRQFLYRRTH